MAIYRVTNKKTKEKVIVIVRTKAGAINHTAKDDYEAEVIGGADLLKEFQAGTKCTDLTVEEDPTPGTQPLPMKDTEAEKHKAAQASKLGVRTNAQKPSSTVPDEKVAASK